MLKELFVRLPVWVQEPVIQAKNKVEYIPYRGQGRLCPVCGKESKKFAAFGNLARADAQCKHCTALERHRLVWLYFRDQTDLFDGKPKLMLHVAPELCFEYKLRKQLGEGYLTADLFDKRAMVKMDITDIHYPDESFDVIYCSHVLEHVQEDKQAIREFYRVLKQDGWAILLVPVTREKTFEDPTIVNPDERLKAYGHKGHVRRYGLDYLDRLQEAGFKVKVSQAADLYDQSQMTLMGLTPASGEIYYCSKQ